MTDNQFTLLMANMWFIASWFLRGSAELITLGIGLIWLVIGFLSD